MTNWRGVILAAAVVAAPCVVGPGYAGAQTLDYEVFKASIQPIFITKRDGYTRCVVCHAGANNGLRLERPGPNGFVVLDFAARKVVKTVELPTDGGVEVIAHRLDSPSHGIGVAPDNKTLWVTSILANAVIAYSLPDLKVIGRVGLPQLKVAGREPMASVPNWVTFTPDSKQIYISNAALNSVTAIDTVAMKEMAVIPVGQAPKRIGTLVAP